MEQEKTYYLWGSKIVRKHNDTNKHFEYHTMGKTFTSLEKAKMYIRRSLRPY
jgi:hypothetical protein